ncbi:2OG-Fe(II) oxygenase [Mariprofundus sp. EBB-1]|uniref:2OG-Fe(II) oxygenase n=1 Tax=Mariprofundus sp. EBB-1 TaxID=2650971 RepID=UPI000EF1FCCD|nr:2OG-Fe(II) oxygenase [Mariprofundus sp. EBB-1]
MIQPLYADKGSTDKFDHIVADLCETGLSVYDDFIPPLLVNNMALEARELFQEGEFRPARVGRGTSLQLRPEIRNDHIHWLDTENPSATQRPYFLDLETLRQHINRSLFLGLFEYEGHFALYPPGAFYNIHYDRFIGALERVVTCILYLNDDWQTENGGALNIHQGVEASSLSLPMQVMPQAGRLVTFISEQFPHEVLPASRDRLSLTGWFRIRT